MRRGRHVSVCASTHLLGVEALPGNFYFVNSEIASGAFSNANSTFRERVCFFGSTCSDIRQIVRSFFSR